MERTGAVVLVPPIREQYADRLFNEVKTIVVKDKAWFNPMTNEMYKYQPIISQGFMVAYNLEGEDKHLDFARYLMTEHETNMKHLETCLQKSSVDRVA